MTTPNYHRVIEANPVVPVDAAANSINMQDLAELGAMAVTHGLTTLQARALIAKIQHTAAQAALSMAPELFEEIRRVNEARYLQMITLIRTLPNTMGWVNRDRVLQVIQNVASSTPRP